MLERQPVSLSRPMITAVLQGITDGEARDATAAGLMRWCSPADVELAMMSVQGQIPSSGRRAELPS